MTNALYKCTHCKWLDINPMIRSAPRPPLAPISIYEYWACRLCGRFHSTDGRPWESPDRTVITRVFKREHCAADDPNKWQAEILVRNDEQWSADKSGNHNHGGVGRSPLAALKEAVTHWHTFDMARVWVDPEAKGEW